MVADQAAVESIGAEAEKMLTNLLIFMALSVY